MRAAELDTGLPVEPADRLLERITCAVYLGATLQLSPLERQLEGLALGPARCSRKVGDITWGY